MIKKVMFLLKKSIPILVFVIFAGVFFASCGKAKDTSFSISGYVFDELGVAVENAEIKSELGTVYTNSEGKFTISGVKNSLILEPSKEGYKFSEASRTIFNETSSVIFTAYKYYDICGTVKNNDVLIQGAEIYIDSLSGSFITFSDENGKFYGKNVAGQSKISCSVGGEDYYNSFASISNPEPLIEATTTLSVNFSFDTDDVDFDDIKVFINDVEQPKISKSNATFSNVKCNSIVRLESSKYVFNESSFVVSTLKQAKNIVCKKKYHVSGKVLSLSTPLANSKVFLNDKFATRVDSDGEFMLSDLYGENKLRVECDGFTFDEKIISYSSSKNQLLFDGTKSIEVLAHFDEPNLESLNFSVNAEAGENGTYSFHGVHLGDEILVSSSKYHLSSESILVGFENEYEVFAEAYFDASVLVSNELDAEIYLSREVSNIFSSENAVNQADLKNLYGTYFVSAKFENYLFETKQLNFETNNVTLSYEVPYSVSLEVFSGEGENKITLSGVVAKIGDDVKVSDEFGKISFENLFGEKSILVECDGYTSKAVEVSSQSDNQKIPVNLSYKVSGVILTGKTPVDGVAVKSADEKFQTQTNGSGEFSIELFGTQTLFASKNCYEFETVSVSKAVSVNWDGTYNISGTLTNDEGLVTDEIYVCLYSNSTNELVKYLKTTNGTFSFSGLKDGFLLLTKVDMTEVDGTAIDGKNSGLNPLAYGVMFGGEFNFSSKGFSVSGKVMSGELPVAGANVYAGGSFTMTDDDGKFKFELLTEECTVTVKKDGYEFSQEIPVSEDSQNVNFNGTYAVKGNILINGSNISVDDVKIFHADDVESLTELGKTIDGGNFEIKGLSGIERLKFEKDGFVFDEIEVSQAETISVTCKIKVQIGVLTGSISVTDFNYSVSGSEMKLCSDEKLDLILSYGEIVSFEKLGYVIESLEVKEPGTFDVQSTYSISGKVQSGEVLISGAKISSTSSVVTSNSDGEFTVSGLKGNETLSFELDGFEFDEETRDVSGYETGFVLQVKYNLSGRVLLGSNPVQGVKVVLNGNNESPILTLADGKFEFNGVYGNYDLTFEKESYTFENLSSNFGPDEITVDAFFIVSGKVTSGDVLISGARVVVCYENSVGTEFFAITQNGEFTITGLSATANIIVQKDGYNSVELNNISESTANRMNLTINLSYNVTFIFDTTDVVITDQNQTTYKTGNLKTFTIKNLVGVNKFTLSKAHTKFIIDESLLTVDGPLELEISTNSAYDVDVVITTKNNKLPASGIRVVAGGVSAITGTDGIARFSGVNGRLYMDINGEEVNLESSINSDRILATGNNYSWEIDDKNYGIILFNNAVQHLNNANSVQIFASGTVTPDMGGEQSVSSVYKRSGPLATGNIIKQNLNLGKTVAGIDPTVALIVIREMQKDGTFSYLTKTTKSISNGIANYGALESKSDEYFFDNYGARSIDYSAYKIDKNTVTSLSVSKDYDEKRGEVYVLSLALGSTSQLNYEKQINLLKPSGTTFKGFSKLEQTIKIDMNGWFVFQQTVESYKVSKGLTIGCDSKIDYRYLTCSENEQIGEITSSKITDSLSEETAKKISNLQKLNVIENVIYSKGGK